jgi:hypothetical protein
VTDERAPMPMYHRGDPLPFCTDSCQQHDGKRCRLTGFRPDVMCEPAVRLVYAEVKALRKQLKGAN